MGFNGTTNGDTVGFHMKKEGYNDYTCIYIYTYIYNLHGLQLGIFFRV
jgi:hypothetical protein